MFDKSSFEWLDFKWLTLETLQSFDWQSPFWLYALIGVPFLFLLKWLIFVRFRQKLEVAFPDQNLKSDFWTLLRHVPKVFFSLFLIFILIALARPQKTSEQPPERYTEGIDIMIVMDISESMQIEDFKPNRLEAAKMVANNFIKGRLQDRIGIVVFAGDAFSLAPLTTDYELLYGYLEEIDFRMIQKGGTAIGSAIGVGTNRMRDSETQSKVMILLTDGESNAGTIDPITAAKLARKYNIKIYTIGVGKEGKVPYRNRFGQVQYIDNTLDETVMKQIAQITEGKFFRATDNASLGTIFSTIDKLERSEIKENKFTLTRDYYEIYLTWAFVFLIIWLGLKNTFLVSALED
ncbi:VWA domain-containing protein [Bernardetia sp. ABR2-2B]|uniref:vWA domain-containing protein n=1 Tax=Bernardetia sp. ABR2-2B TaxID=3127472 RepID=UPI0030D3A71D